MLEFFVELVPQGELTPHLYKLHPGDKLLCRKIAKGRFTLDLKSGRTNHLLLATVTGLAPFVSYARTLYKDWRSGSSPMPGNHKLYCLQGGSRSWEFGYRDEMEKYAAEAPWLKYVTTVSRPWEDTEWRGETGRVDDLVRKYTDVWGLKPEDTTAYLCGHPSMVENGRGILQRAGWQKGSMFEEVYFQPAKARVSKLSRRLRCCSVGLWALLSAELFPCCKQSTVFSKKFIESLSVSRRDGLVGISSPG